MTPRTTSRRLPGFSFEVQPPPLTDVLPRMDVAVFVGFAAAGPLHTPVVVEDASHFQNIFGEDLPLAYDRQRGETVYAYLAPAVRSFFRNGGRRCWVVRVADATMARPNYFPMPGLAQLQSDGKIASALAQANSVGSWSDNLMVGTALLSQALAVTNVIALSTGCNLVLAANPGQVVPGDLLRLTFPAEDYVVMTVVQSVNSTDQLSSPLSNQPGGARLQVIGKAAQTLWFKTQAFIASPPPAAIAYSLINQQEQPLKVLDWRVINQTDNQQSIQLNLALDMEAAPTPGSLLRIEFTGHTSQLWLTVQNTESSGQGGSPLMNIIQVTGQGLWYMPQPPTVLPTSIPDAERLSFELSVRRPDSTQINLSDLAFASPHPRFWGALPTNEVFYQSEPPAHDATYMDLWQEANNKSFPLAGQITSKSNFYFPIAMPVVPDPLLQAVEQLNTPLERDGLAHFTAELFLDPALQDVLSLDLMNRADFIRYQSSQPCALTGIHAALAIEEATLIVVPDAVHPGWFPAIPGPPVINPAPSLFPHPRWWIFKDCPIMPVPLANQPEWGNFLDCDLRILAAPVLSENHVQTSTFTLTWTGLAETGVRYILEEATLPDFSGAVVIYNGPEQRLVVYGRAQGVYYYRVRLEVTEASSDWSNGVGLEVVPPAQWELQPVASTAVLLKVQLAVLRMCAARGDLFAVLSLPQAMREDAAISYVNSLKATVGTATTINPGGVNPLSYQEVSALSYGAVYHPWLIIREANRATNLRFVPPDGAACGIIAQRALIRGVWIAPANELLNDIVALTPAIPVTSWQILQDAQINLIQHVPRGFVTLSADTLSDDPDLLPINVRRLLILLRRLALQLGATYVFEPNDDSFRRMVQRGFEAMLGLMFARGAFAGDTADTSFQVVTSSSLNTRQSMDQGRFIVELRVAPSLPLTFLTIRLVQTGDRNLVTEGR